MKLYCPECREINDQGRKTCVYCGSPLHGPEGETYVEKLVWALDHPEPGTALRVATILGDLKAREATEPLTKLLKNPGKDPYLRAAAARSLGAIGDPDSRAALIEALGSGPIQVRLAAVDALERLGPDEAAVRALSKAATDRSYNLSRAARKAWDRLQQQ
jgi:HEAT repeat protein